MTNAKDSQINLTRTVTNLPESIVTDEKVQAQVAGILYGRFTVAKKGVTPWAILGLVLREMAIKSMTHAPDAALMDIEKRYKPIVENFRNFDYYNPLATKKAATRIAEIMLDSGVKFTEKEAERIIFEIRTNPKLMKNCIVNTVHSFEELERKIK